MFKRKKINFEKLILTNSFPTSKPIKECHIMGWGVGVGSEKLKSVRFYLKDSICMRINTNSIFKIICTLV